jgi:hypothetical protein
VICVSELAIDRLLAGELADFEATATRQHASACARCRGILDDAEATAARFAAAPPILRLPRRVNPAALVAAGFAAAAVLAIPLWPKPDRRGGAHEMVQPGDQLELVTTANDTGWLAVVSIDGAGARTVYVEPRPIAAGHEQIVPLAIVLDDTLGDETVTGMFCSSAFDPAAPPDDCTFDRFTFTKVAR